RDWTTNPFMVADPGHLMDRNVEYQSINYRLGSLGFLSTEDDVVSENMGLKVDAFSGTPFTFIIENKLPGAFITDYPYKLLKSGNITDVPWITGATTEGEITGIVALKFQFEDLNER
ncbi:hypothetical protein ILUMI_18643, partial [Ignelater luminosus]